MNRLSNLWPLLILSGCCSTHPSTPPVSLHQSQANAIAADALKLDTPSSQAALFLFSADHDSNRTVETIRAIQAARALILDDLRNADTPGYKASLAIVPANALPLLQRDMTQGAYQSTGRSIDLSIQGPGFFKIKCPTDPGVLFTRNGSFFINNQSQLVLGLGDGYKLLPPITLPPRVTEVSISSDGIIEVLLPGSTAKSRVGQIQIFHFLSPESLHPQGGPLLSETPLSGPPIDKPGHILQGFLESSNTDLIRARVRLRFLQEWESTLLATIDPPHHQ